ncbi:hypothetical protein [Azospirillum argentinense]
MDGTKNRRPRDGADGDSWFLLCTAGRAIRASSEQPESVYER